MKVVIEIAQCELERALRKIISEQCGERVALLSTVKFVVQRSGRPPSTLRWCDVLSATAEANINHRN